VIALGIGMVIVGGFLYLVGFHGLDDAKKTGEGKYLAVGVIIVAASVTAIGVYIILVGS
jgi:hypothetical protein